MITNIKYKLMKHYILTSFAISAMLMSCADDVSQPGTGSEQEYETLSLSTASTRTSLDGYNLKWTQNDRIVVNGEIYNVTLDDNGDASVDVRKADSYQAFYPACFYESMEGDELVYDVSWYSSQGVGKNKLGDDVLPMYAKSDDTHLVFNALQPLVKIHVTGPKRCDEFLVFAKNGSSLKGKFTYDLATGAMTSHSELKYPDNYTAIFNANDNFSSKGQDYYFSLPTNIGNDIYSEGLVLEIPYMDFNDKSSIHRVNFPADMELKPGVIIEMPEIVVPKVEGDILYSEDNGETWKKSIPLPVPSKLMVKTTGNRCVNSSDYGKIMKAADEEGDDFRFDLDLSQAANWAAFNTDWVDIYPNYGCANVRSVVMPNNIERSTIYNYHYFRNLEEIAFPPSLKSMHGWSGDENAKLKTIRMYAAEPPVVSENEFYNMGASAEASERMVYVPSGSVDKYLNAPGWKDLFEGGKSHIYKFNIKELEADDNPYAK